MYKVLQTEYDWSSDSTEVSAVKVDTWMIQHSHTLWNAMMYAAEQNKDQTAIINLDPNLYKEWTVARENKYDLLGLIEYNSRLYPARDKFGNRLIKCKELYPVSLVIDWEEFWEDVL